MSLPAGCRCGASWTSGLPPTSSSRSATSACPTPAQPQQPALPAAAIHRAVSLQEGRRASAALLLVFCLPSCCRGAALQTAPRAGQLSCPAGCASSPLRSAPQEGDPPRVWHRDAHAAAGGAGAHRGGGRPDVERPAGPAARPVTAGDHDINNNSARLVAGSTCSRDHCGKTLALRDRRGSENTLVGQGFRTKIKGQQRSIGRLDQWR